MPTLGVRRHTRRDDDQVVEALRKSNDLPSNDQREMLSSRLRDLETEFQRLAGLPFTTELKRDQIPKAAQDVSKDIRLRRALLSGVRNIPEEILQLIFELVVLKNTGMYCDHSSLSQLCKVSSRWREATIRHGVLWTRTPPIFVWRTKAPKLRRLTARLRVYLERSGGHAVNIDLKILSKDWEKVETEEACVELLQALADHCHHWGKVLIAIPLEWYAQYLPSIRGRMHMLQDIHITDFYGSYPEPENDKFTLDCFAEAPALRKIKYDVESAFRNDMDSAVVFCIDVPWAQLQSFEAHSLCDTSFQKLLQIRPESLQELIYHAERVEESELDDSTDSRSPPILFPNLTKLVLRSRSPTTTTFLLSQMERLLLPSLTHLEIRGKFPSDRLFGKVLALIAQSGCSLKHLHLSTTEGRINLWNKILAMSPDLEELSLRTPTEVFLGTLILDTASPAPILPKLKILTILGTDTDGANRLIDPPILRSVIDSRTKALANEAADPHGITQTLEEVNVQMYDDMEMLVLQVSMLEASNESTSDTPLTELSSLENLSKRARFTLYNEILHKSHPRRAFLNLKLHVSTHKLMGELEGLDFTSQCSRTVMEFGIPLLLAALAREAPGDVPGDRMFRFRARARKLLDTWKPFLLRDAHPFHWSYLAVSYAASMRWVLPDSSSDPLKAEEHLWKDIASTAVNNPSRLISFDPCY